MNSGHIILSNEDFDAILEDLLSDSEPSEIVKRARERFLSLKARIKMTELAQENGEYD